MVRVLSAGGRYILGCVIALAVLALPAHAKKLHVLYSFAGGSDGVDPYAGVIADAKGNLYGTTVFGGTSNAGTIFKVATDGTETVLHTFVGYPNDGEYPYGGLIADGAGNLYGTTNIGGDGHTGFGTVFRLAPDGTETVLYSFCSLTVCEDGSDPQGGVIRDKKGNLYGTTTGGGSGATCGTEELGCGTVFRLAPDGTETVLYSFCVQTSCVDGSSPGAGLIADKAGNLYGTTTAGGANNGGTVFRIATDGTHAVLYSFCSLASCADGTDPTAGLIADSSGNLYGTTYGGGSTCTNGCGVVFRLATNGTETVLYAFKGGTDGRNPYAGLIADSSGNLYGTTELGGGTNNCGVGPAGCGTVFALAPDGTERVLHAFGKGSHGAYPYGGLIKGAKGRLYGTTAAGGQAASGTVFMLRK